MKRATFGFNPSRPVHARLEKGRHRALRGTIAYLLEDKFRYDSAPRRPDPRRIKRCARPYLH